jgi:hypothetical protein
MEARRRDDANLADEFQKREKNFPDNLLQAIADVFSRV